jgi:hypothetical protein
MSAGRNDEALSDGPEYFAHLAEKLRDAGGQICSACRGDLSPAATGPTETCVAIDCMTNRIFSAADDIDRDGACEGESAA